MLTPNQTLYGLRYDSLILHCPRPMRVKQNPFHTQWEEACRTLLSDPSVRGSCHNDPRLTVLTYNTSSTPCLLEQCAAHIGLNGLIVLGRSVKKWQWIEKVRLVAEYLQSGACQSEYLLCLDGDDVLILSSAEEILSRYLDTRCEILFCNTRGDQPPSPECWEFENSVTEYTDPLHRHLNAGGYIGRVSYIQDCLREILNGHESAENWCFSKSGFDDQLAWRHMHRSRYPGIKVDAACRIFLRFDEDR